MTSNSFVYEGVYFFTNVVTPEDIISIRDEFVVRDEDIITLSYPKSGTNWMIEIINLIHCKGDNTWVQSVPNFLRSPWLETKDGYKSVSNIKDGVRFYTSHLPIQLFPKSFFNSKAKVIYIIRNPRDVMVSTFYFSKGIKFAKPPEKFEQFFDHFLQGEGNYGTWFDHVRGWLQMRGRENFLMIAYEELHQDTRRTVERISQFLGKKLEPEELDSVLKNMSFQVMKRNDKSNFSEIPGHILDLSKAPLMRKGITEDWKNHFTVAQSEAFDKIYQEKRAELPQGIFPWEK
ncbi:PREDICTED: bile salt sulfotransferase-like [Elephantulus edwardii]|uniref:bile salt sulfotransferase-like n=1 Tax=Elephantulus edwardii TaxID=28737 RepID=UPI0003F06A51|nr:PREDICTED: bile salt sulfotransferase-like [Elephantulus edwardii]